MSYIKTKLTNRDKDILSEIYNELEQITLNKSIHSKNRGHAVRTGTIKQLDARQSGFGEVYYQGKIKESCINKKYPQMIDLFKKFIKSHYPKFKFSGVYVNKNTVCKKHIDSKNTGESLLVGFGPYTFGKTVLYPIGLKPKKFHIKTSSLIFNGSEITHNSEPFNGTRYSLVFYNRNL